MAALQATGIGSNMDVGSLVSQLMTIERRPLDQISSTERSYQTKISAFGQIKSALSALSDAATALQGSSSKFQSLKTSSSDETAVTATASDMAAGAVAIQVNQLAQQQVLASSAMASASTAVGGGQLNITFGSFDGSSFTTDTSRTALSVSVAAGSSLASIRDAINQANGGVRASVITDSAGSRLALSTVDGGAQATMKITVTDDDGQNLDTAGLSQLAYDPAAAVGAGQNMTQRVAGRNAEAVVDGITVTSTSNQLKNVVDGMQVNLLKTTTSPVTVTMTRDSTEAKAAVESFVKAYNDYVGKSRELSAYNAETRVAAALQGDSSVRTISAGLRAIMGATTTMADGSKLQLSDIGITSQTDGKLKLDSTAFDKAYLANPSGVEKLFSQTASGAATDGLAVQIKAAAKQHLDAEGLLASRTEGLNARMQSLSKRREVLNLRLEQIQERYTRQFTALDATMGKANATSSYLTQHLSSLNKS